MMKDKEILKQIIKGLKSSQNDYEKTRKTIIKKVGYNKFRNIQAEAFKKYLY